MCWGCNVKQTIYIAEDDVGKRVDAVLATKIEGLSRSRIQALIESGHILLGDKPISSKHKIKLHDIFDVVMPEVVSSELQPVPMDLDIVYEDDDLLVVNKPVGLTVHPAAGNYEHTLVHGLLAHCGDSLSGIGGVSRPGIVHRLDKDTSGLMVVAKHDAAHQGLSAQLSDRSLTRVYHALVWGCPQPDNGIIEGNIDRSPKDRKKMALVKEGGREAITHYRTLRCFSVDDKHKTVVISEVECRLKTGRTHQIRVHMSHSGYPLVGDQVYGGATAAHRLARWNNTYISGGLREALQHYAHQALHAKEIAFIHPMTQQTMRFTSDFPQDWERLITLLTSELIEDV